MKNKKRAYYKLINYHEEVYGHDDFIPYSMILRETEKKLFKISNINNLWKIENSKKQDISKHIYHVYSNEIKECLESSYLTRRSKKWIIESILEHGILVPLLLGIVNPLSSSCRQYVTIDGDHRISIAKLLGIKEVPALLFEMKYEEE